MILRSRPVLIAVSAAILLLLLLALLQAPPDGREHGDLSQFIGRFHPLVVHLPIALLLLVPLLECFGLLQRWSHLRESAGFVLILASISAFIAVFLGWLLAWSGAYEGQLVKSHMWGGFSLAVAIFLCCLLRLWNVRVYRIALLLTLALLVWTSDKGGKLTHGESFMTRYMPNSLRSLLHVPGASNKIQAAVKTAAPPLTNASVGVSRSATFYDARVAPIFGQKCTGCHNAEKRKGKLRLDTFENVMRGGKDGIVVRPGDTSQSELFRRINLSPEEKDFMPTDGKPPLTAPEIKVIELWIASGATNTLPEIEVHGTPPLPAPAIPALPLTKDYRPQLKTISALEQELGVRLVPRSQNPNDGLILRTVSAPERCDDKTLARLKSVADLIVDAELARTKVTDEGLTILSTFSNLRSIDLAHTTVTSKGVPLLTRLNRLETLNLTATSVDDPGVVALRHKPSLKHLYLFETKCTVQFATQSNKTPSHLSQ